MQSLDKNRQAAPELPGHCRDHLPSAQRKSPKGQRKESNFLEPEGSTKGWWSLHPRLVDHCATGVWGDSAGSVLGWRRKLTAYVAPFFRASVTTVQNPNVCTKPKRVHRPRVQFPAALLRVIVGGWRTERGFGVTLLPFCSWAVTLAPP